MFWRFNKALHVISGTSILIITLVMGLLAMKRGGWKIDIMWHTVMGFIIMVAVGVIVLGGVIAAIASYSVRWNTALVLKIKFGHKLFGYLMIFLSQIAIVLGGYKWSSYEEKSNPYVVIHIVIFFLIVIICEGIYYRFNLKETAYVEPKNVISR